MIYRQFQLYQRITEKSWQQEVQEGHDRWQQSEDEKRTKDSVSSYPKDFVEALVYDAAKKYDPEEDSAYESSFRTHLLRRHN